MLVYFFNLSSAQHSQVTVSDISSLQGSWRGLTIYLQLLIAGNEMPSGADHQTRLRQPSAIFKPPSISTSLFVCWAMPALNGTLPFPFIFLWKFIRYCMHVFQGSHLRDVDKMHTCNFNQLDPLDVELKMRWVYLSLSLSLALLSGCLLS